MPSSAAEAERPAFLYTIPTFQNPSGRTLSVERRGRIVEIAREHELPVLEDDPYGLVRYEGEALPSLLELEGGDARHLHVVVLEDRRARVSGPDTSSCPSQTAPAFEERAVSTYISPPFLTQATVAEFVERGRFEPNLARVCAELRARRDAMLGALEASFGDGATWSRRRAGTSSGSTAVGDDGGDLAGVREREQASRSSQGAGSSPAGRSRARPRRASRSATRRRRGSSKASSCSRGASALTFARASRS